MDRIDLVAGKYGICQGADRRINITLAKLAVELRGVGRHNGAFAVTRILDYMSLLRHNDHAGNHLLHSPGLVLGVHAHVADNLIAGGGKREVGLHLSIDGSEQLLRALAFVLLLLRFGGNHHLFEVYRLLFEHNHGGVGSLRAIGSGEVFEEQGLLLVADERHDEFGVGRQIGGEVKQSVVGGSGADNRIVCHIDGSITDRFAFLVHYAADIIRSAQLGTEAE